MKVDKQVRDCLLEIQKKKRVSLEGNILKLIEAEDDDEEFKTYISTAIEKDKDGKAIIDKATGKPVVCPKKDEKKAEPAKKQSDYFQCGVTATLNF